MKIDFHSEKFKKTMVWIIALVILPAFLLGGGALSGLFSSGPQNRLEEIEVTVFDDEIDPEEYYNFSQRWSKMFGLTAKLETIYTKEELNAIVKKINEAASNGFPGARQYTIMTAIDAYLPGGMIWKVTSWIPGDQGENMAKLNQEKSDPFKNPVIASLFARAHLAEKYDLMPSDMEIDGKLYYWFNKPDYNINKQVFDPEAYKTFLTKLYGNIPYETADTNFRKTVGEYIAMDRLENSGNSPTTKKSTNSPARTPSTASTKKNSARSTTSAST